MSTHARFSPSQLSRIIACPASLSMEESLPNMIEEESTYAQEGTMLHEVVEHILETGDWPDKDNYDLDREQKEAVEIAVDYIGQFRKGDYILWTEKKVYMGQFPEVRGTADVVIITDGQIHLLDLKFGGGVFVENKDNPQLLAYLSGVLTKMKKEGFSVHDRIMFTHVIQPRMDNMTVEEVEASDLLFFYDTIAKTIELANSANPDFNPGDKQCRWCKAAGSCRARLSQVSDAQMKAIQVMADLDMGKHMSKEELLDILNLEEQVKACYKDIRNHLFNQMVNGEKLEGYKLARTSKHRAWVSGTTVDTILEVAPELEDAIDEIVETKLLSPAKIEKLLPKVDRDKLASLIHKPEGELTMVAASSRLPEVTLKTSAETFADFID